MSSPSKSVSIEVIQAMILIIRGRKVMLDSDLADLYGVETKYLTRQVKRNQDRFPDDFMFRLTQDEYLRCQNVTSKRGGRRYMPYAFTEQGVAMLSSVLRSKNAVQVNMAIMRTFVKLRELMITHKELALKIDALERKLRKHDEHFAAVFHAIREIMKQESKPKGKIGFHVHEKD